MNDLTGQVIFITGASSGIGKNVAIQAVKRGATVILTARNIKKLAEVKYECEQERPNSAHIYELDVTNTENIESVTNNVFMNFEKVDVVVNSAGFGDFTAVVESDPEVTKSMVEVNTLGLMYISRLFAQHMIIQEHGHIVNIGSMAGKIPTTKSGAYAASKAAVIAFSDSLRLELEPLGIYVTTVNPGPVKTNFFEIADKSGDYLEKVGFIALDPENLAKKIVRQFGKNKRELNLPHVMNGFHKFYVLFPKLGDKLVLTRNRGEENEKKSR